MKNQPDAVEKDLEIQAENDDSWKTSDQEVVNDIQHIEVPQTVLSSDCGEWPVTITDSTRQILVIRGPPQIKEMNFPVDASGRKFTLKNVFRKLCNGEQIKREWLIYSVAKDKIYCFCCRLFGTETISVSSSSGYSDWKNMSVYLSRHEKSLNHIKATQSWQELSHRLHLNKTIDEENQRLIRAETEHWNEVLKRLLCIVQFLASQGLAFRGKSDVLFEDNNGNFLKLVEYIAKFDVVLAEHLRRKSSGETRTLYLSKTIQNEFISLISKEIKEKILSSLKEAVYFSIILDCTPDASHIEQMTMIVRFVKAISGEEVSIQEHFLGFVPINDSSGEGIKDYLLEELAKNGLQLNNMRGQGYDNGSNMKGKNVGVQKRILEVNPRAFFVPCSNHSLNLVVNDGAKSCSNALEFFSIVQEIFNYFSASTYRWSILKNHITSLTVKPLSTTRWESRIDAVTPLRFNVGEVYDALFEASKDQKQDAFARNTAKGIAKKLKNFKFLCSLVVWHLILSKINLVSKHLQEISNSLETAMELIDSAKTFLKSMRTEESLNSAIIDAKELAEILDANPDFERETHIRPRKIKKQFDYEQQDEPVPSGIVSFKVNFYYAVLDVAIASFDERFQQMKSHSDNFSFLYDIHGIAHLSKIELEKNCLNLQKILTHGEECDIDGQEIHQELIILSQMIPSETTPVNALNYITKNKLINTFPNVFVSLRILLTLPISVASGERSFSKLKLIKNYLRSSISQERLCDLATISIEKKILETLDIATTLKNFALMKARKVNL